MRLLEQLVTIGPRACRRTAPPQGHRVLLADIAARGVDDGQAVGIGVLAEADVGPGGRDGRADAGKVLGRRFGRVGELAVGSSPRIVTVQPSSSSRRRPSGPPAP